MKLQNKRIRFVLKGPWEKHRRSFVIVKDTVHTNGRRETEIIRDPRIDALNKQFSFKNVTVEEGRKNLAKIKEKLESDLSKQLPKQTFASYNLRILNNYIERVIKPSRASEDSKISHETHIRKVIRLLGNHSLRTVPVEVLQEIADREVTKGGNVKVINSLKALLKFTDRIGVEIRPKEYPKKPISYLTSEQVHTLAESVPDWLLEKYPAMPEFILILFNTGARISEGLAVQKASVAKVQGTVVIKIEKQFKRWKNKPTPELTELKNKRPRVVVPIDYKETLKCLEKWIKLHPTLIEREKYRHSVPRFIKAQCYKLFKIKTEAAENFFDLENIPELNEDREYKAAHMLRASHAVHLISHGFTLEDAANQLGDGKDVTEKYYSGFVNTEASIKNIASRLISLNK